jgi:hypothetical protein
MVYDTDRLEIGAATRPTDSNQLQRIPWRMTMTTSPAAGTTQAPAALTQRENERAVERIEAAERYSPHCPCGSHMVAVAHGDEVWLECVSHDQPRAGLRGLVARLTAFAHSRRLILELPATD